MIESSVVAVQKIASPSFDESEISALRRCLASGWVTQGPFTNEFEKLVAARQGVAHALATTSCTAALHLSVMALGLKPNDEVVVPAFTWITSAHAVEYVGARVVFADIDPLTYNIDTVALESAITSRTRAVVAVHLFGLAAEMDAIREIGGRHGLAIIEDAACAIGTTYNGKPVGGLGDLGCFSFHPRKVITTGEGGMVTTNNAEFAKRIASFRNHGSTGLPSVDREPHGPWTMATFDNLGFNLRLSDIQAAVGVAQMPKLEGLLAERRRAARHYLELLCDVQEVVLPTAGDVSGHTFQSFVIRIATGGRSRRNAIMARLAEARIETRPGTHAVHKLGYYRAKYGLSSGMFPVAAEAEDSTITLPIFPGITPEQQRMTVRLIKEALVSN